MGDPNPWRRNALSPLRYSNATLLRFASRYTTTVHGSWSLLPHTVSVLSLPMHINVDNSPMDVTTFFSVHGNADHDNIIRETREAERMRTARAIDSLRSEAEGLRRRPRTRGVEVQTGLKGSDVGDTEALVLALERKSKVRCWCRCLGGSTRWTVVAPLRDKLLALWLPFALNCCCPGFKTNCLALLLRCLELLFLFGTGCCGFCCLANGCCCGGIILRRKQVQATCYVLS